MSSPTVLETLKTPIRKSPRGMSGSAAQRSTRQNAMTSTTDVPSSPRICLEAHRIGRSSPCCEKDDGRDRGAQERDARVVDGVLGSIDRYVQDGRDDEEGDDPDREVDVEDPAPGEVLGEQPAEQRTGDAGDAEHRAEVAHVASSLAGAHDVSDDRLGSYHESAGPHALDGPEGDQLGHRMRESRES